MRYLIKGKGVINSSALAALVTLFHDPTVRHIEYDEHHILIEGNSTHLALLQQLKEGFYYFRKGRHSGKKPPEQIFVGRLEDCRYTLRNQKFIREIHRLFDDPVVQTLARRK